MPNSLKCRLKGLVRKGLLSEKDLSRIYTENDVVEELENIKNKLHEKSWSMIGIATDRQVLDLYEADKVINDRISELKGDNK